MQKLLIALLSLLWASAQAGDLEDLARDGYGVVTTTYVSGTFNGCEFDQKILLENGLIFVCQSYNYHYAYHPEVLILKNVRTSAIKVMIDEEEFDGYLTKR